MSLLFRPNASRTEIVYTAFVYISFIALFYGFFTSIAPRELVQQSWMYPALALTQVYCLPLLFAGRTNRAPDVSLPKIVLGYFVLCLFSFGLAAYLTVYSFPSIFTALMGQHHEFRSVVEAKDGTSRGCRHDIKLKDFGYGIHEMVCTDPSLWERIRVGDVVRVDSSKSALGIKVSDIEIER
jgi:hypothetical protein